MNRAGECKEIPGSGKGLLYPEVATFIIVPLLPSAIVSNNPYPTIVATWPVAKSISRTA